MVAAAARILDGALGQVLACSPVIESAPVGPSLRRYANAALLLESTLAPHDLLDMLQAVEAQLGRVRRGQRWRSRVIDLDIVLWSGGTVNDAVLAVPHPLFRDRDFVLRPAAAIVPAWRDPMTGRSLAQLLARLTRRRPLPR